MFGSIPYRSGLIGLAAICCITIAMANGNSRRPKSPPAAEKALLAGSGVPVQVRSILQRACQNCHSDNTAWPWYAGVPPVSWQIQSDVTRGRAFMNFSRWSEYSDAQQRGFRAAILAAAKARLMPPPKYVWMHGNARLSDADMKELEKWAFAGTRISLKNDEAGSR